MEKSYIPKGMKITGDVVSDGDLQIAGEVNGNVSIEGTLELNGSVKGDNIKVGSVELTEGTIQSNIECRDHIGIGSGVTVIGNIKAGDAQVNGAVKGDIDVAENLAVGSAEFNSVHHNIFSRHKGKLFTKSAFDNFRIYNQTVGNISVKIQNSVNSKERLGNA